MASAYATSCLLVLVLIAIAVPITAVEDAEEWRRKFGDPEKFCQEPCVLATLAHFCNNIDCQLRDLTQEFVDKLCVDTCVLGIASETMTNCLSTAFPHVANVTKFQHVLLNDANINCDGHLKIEHTIEAEGSIESVPFEEVYPLSP